MGSKSEASDAPAIVHTLTHKAAHFPLFPPPSGHLLHGSSRPRDCLLHPIARLLLLCSDRSSPCQSLPRVDDDRGRVFIRPPSLPPSLPPSIPPSSPSRSMPCPMTAFRTPFSSSLPLSLPPSLPPSFALRTPSLDHSHDCRGFPYRLSDGPPGHFICLWRAYDRVAGGAELEELPLRIHLSVGLWY